MPALKTKPPLVGATNDPEPETTDYPIPVPPPVPVELPADSSGRACVLTFADLARLSALLGYNCRSPLDLIMQCEKLSQIRTENTEVIFEPGLLQRLESRCPKGIPFSVFLKAQVIRWAHDYCGW